MDNRFLNKKKDMNKDQITIQHYQGNIVITDKSGCVLKHIEPQDSVDDVWNQMWETLETPEKD